MDADGTTTTEHADALVSAVGQLNRPSFPAIKGRDSFGGRSFHSGRMGLDSVSTWPGQRVAVFDQVHGGQCGTVRPGRRRRGGPPRPLPAHAALAYADGELPRPVPPGLSLAVGAGCQPSRTGIA